jgi:wyosine [tRNA(Phe)-imidazoG37] synthetase (radical SAM superfamily)
MNHPNARNKNSRHVYGIVPSRRLGRSLGVSTVPFKVCNYSCVYCQLGRTTKICNTRQSFYPPNEILGELEEFLKVHIENEYDVITLVSEGEPLLYRPIDIIISGIKRLSKKPVVVITNGSLCYDENVRNEVRQADIIMPTLDAWDEESFKRINRPFGKLSFEKVYRGLLELRNSFPGEIWLEVMLIKGLNDSKEQQEKLAERIAKLKPDRVYVNVPLRPPAEPWIEKPDESTIKRARELLNATSIEKGTSGKFVSSESNAESALLEIIKRHPMSRNDICSFLEQRKINCKQFLREFEDLVHVKKIVYNGIVFYRFMEEG